MGPRLASGPGTAEAGQAGPSLELRNTIDSGSIWSLRFSRTKRGSLGLLSSSGQFKMFDIAKEYLSEENRHSVDETLGQGSSASYPEQIYTKNVRDIRHSFEHKTRGTTKSARIVSFDFLNMSQSNEPSALTLLGNGKVEIATVQSSASPIRLSSQNTLVRGISQSYCDFEALNPRPQNGKISDVLQSLRSEAQAALNNQGEEGKCLSSRDSREHAFFLGTPPGIRLHASDALVYLNMTQARCKEGYLFNEEKNQHVVADDPDLQDFWAWVKRKLSISHETLAD